MSRLFQASIASSRYGRVEVLRDVAIEIGEGEIVAVVGSNGAGKTTLLRTLSGVMVRSSASLSLDDRDISRLSATERVRAGIVHVPEGRRVFSDLSVVENLRVAGYAQGISSDTLNDGLAQVFDLFPILAERREQPANTLSGGQQQMLAIGRGLVLRPRILMVDETSLGLAPTVIDSLFDALSQLGRRGLAILLVEQNVRAAFAIASRAYVLDRGTMRLSGDTAALLIDDRVAATYLGGHVTTGE